MTVGECFTAAPGASPAADRGTGDPQGVHIAQRAGRGAFVAATVHYLASGAQQPRVGSVWVRNATN